MNRIDQLKTQAPQADWYIEHGYKFTSDGYQYRDNQYCAEADGVREAREVIGVINAEEIS